MRLLTQSHKSQEQDILFKFNGNFKICSTEDDGCTLTTSAKLKKLMFMRLYSIWIFYRKNLQINGTFFASYGTHFMTIFILLVWGFLCVRDAGHKNH